MTRVRPWPIRSPRFARSRAPRSARQMEPLQHQRVPPRLYGLRTRLDEEQFAAAAVLAHSMSIGEGTPRTRE